jgi:hypothetical protein
MDWNPGIHHRERGSGVASTQRIPCRRKSHLAGSVERVLAALGDSTSKYSLVIPLSRESPIQCDSVPHKKLELKAEYSLKPD